jgi:HAD superfamily hydrolase (TIGR01484 family)
MDIKTKKLAIFDLDGTLAPSKSPLEKDMSELLVKLLKIVKVAVISGGAYPQFQSQFLSQLPHSNESYGNLLLLPTSGTQLFTWKGDWHQEYAEFISKEDRENIIQQLTAAMKKTGYHNPPSQYGEIIEDRLSQITFSGIGQKAPLAEKQKWDPDRSKRQRIVTLLAPKIPRFDVRLGGISSIDITPKGVNKAYGIRKLEQYLNVHADEIVFVGDALYHGGNDFPARATGVECIEVRDPEDTKKLVREWLSA